MVAVIVRMRGDVLFMLEKYPNNCLPKKHQVALIGAGIVLCVRLWTSKVLAYANTLGSESKLSGEAMPKAVNTNSLIFGRQSILKQPKHYGSRSRKRKICFMRLNFILRRYHFLPRFVDKFSRRRLRISVCEKRVFGSNDGEVKKCIFAYFGVDK